MSAPIAISDETIDQLTEDTMNYIAGRVQKTLGVKHGDVMGLYFSGVGFDDPGPVLKRVISAAIRTEELFMEDAP